MIQLVPYVVYDPRGDRPGHLHMIGAVKESDLQRQADLTPDLVLLFGAEATDLENEYVHEKEVKPRPVLPIEVSGELIADGESECVLSGFPQPCTVVIDGESYELEDGSVTLTAETDATYRLSCSHWPYLDWEMEITAV